MYVNKEGDILNQQFIDKYNQNKFAFAILRNFPYRLSDAELFDDLDHSISSFHKWISIKPFEIRRRVSNTGCELLYCIVGDRKLMINYSWTIPEPWIELPAIDFKYFKEPVFRSKIPTNLINLNKNNSETSWNNRLIRCKKIRNWSDEILNELQLFAKKMNLIVEFKKPYVKFLFKDQKMKEDVFQQMKIQYDNNGININYFRKMLNWINVSIDEYERHTQIKN